MHGNIELVICPKRHCLTKFKYLIFNILVKEINGDSSFPDSFRSIKNLTRILCQNFLKLFLLILQWPIRFRDLRL
jgi:hypothetical protein